MIAAMLLAHIVVDYVLQWDGLARWKSERLSGVVVHGGIVLVVTWLLSLPYTLGWWPYALFIGLTHTLIDALRTRVGRVSSRTALGLFLLDQALHLTIILAMLSLSGYLAQGQIVEEVVRWAQDVRLITFVIGYTFITMPAWIIVRFLVWGLVDSTETMTFPSVDKYIGILERGLITTLVILGQFFLIPLVAAPRLVFDGPRIRENGMTSGYVAELLASAAVAIAVGLALRQV
jgi:hypothetical protein